MLLINEQAATPVNLARRSEAMPARIDPPINLLRGWPSPTLLPTAEMLTAASGSLGNPSTAIPGLLYGADGGYQPLREALALWLSSLSQMAAPDADGGLGARATASRFCITGGASQNIACLLAVFSDPIYTRNIWMVAPTYFMACRIFEDAGFAGRLRAVPEDEEGVDLGFLERALEREKREREARGGDDQLLKPLRPASRFYRHIIYCVPTFSNPTGRSMTLRRRKGLVRLARRYDALLISDDVYDCLHWRTGDLGEEPPVHAGRLIDVDQELDGGPGREGAHGFGNAVSNGSFSKIVGPGVRTGWAEGTEKLAFGLSQCGTSKSGGAPSHLVATFLTQFITTGALTTHIHGTLTSAYSTRYHWILDAIRIHLAPHGCTLPSLPPSRSIVGGYFIWVELPAQMRAVEVATRAKDRGVVVAEGNLFGVWGDDLVVKMTEGMSSEEAEQDGKALRALQRTLERGLRLCFAWLTLPEMARGVEVVGHVVAELLTEKQTLADDMQRNEKADSAPTLDQWH